MNSRTDETNRDNTAKAPYEKPKLTNRGRVEEITLKNLGHTDAFLFRGSSGGGGGGGGDGNLFSLS